MVMAPLRIAALVASAEALPRWAARLLEAIRDDDRLQLVGLIEAGRRRDDPDSLPWFVRVWFELEARVVAREPARRLHGPCPAPIGVQDRDAIAALDLDVLLDLTGWCGEGLDPSSVRQGVWFTDSVGPQRGMAGFRGVARGWDIATLSLFRRVQRGSGPEPIATAAVNPKYLATRNELFLKEKSVTLILRELRRLALTGRAGRLPDRTFEPVQRPRASEFIRYLGKVAAETVRRLVEKALGRVGFRPGMFMIQSLTGELLGFDPALGRANLPRANVYQADPFLWQREGRTYCFFEDYDYRSATGHICVGVIDGGLLSEVRTAIRPGYHLSFPFVFEHHGQLYMMPESCAKKRIEIWRCTTFPDRWELHSTAMEGVSTADSSIAEIDGQWWLFTNVSTDPFGDMNSELHVFRLDGPNLESITPHLLNPVMFDARCARNAGRVIRQGEVYYRPAQENSHGTYGYGINLMRIETLSLGEYRETLARRIQPDFAPGLIGCHHLDVRGGVIVFDVRKRYGGYAQRAPKKARAA